LQSLIRRSVSRRGIGLSIAVIAVGMVTAAGEFFCAGQLYAAVLVANTQTGASRLPLVIYCLAFLVPSVAMLAAVSVSRRTLGSTDWVLKRLPVIKWVTAAVMAVLIVYTWVV
jgi:cytochrome c biogenesis protein CcdA